MPPSARSRGKRLTRGLLAVCAPLCFFGVLELLVVAAGFRYPALKSPISLPLPEGEVDGRFMHERDAHELWRLVAGAVVPWGRDTINADGMRGPAVARAKTAGVVRIAALGDSSTFGFGVRYEECWAGRLAAELATRGVRAEVLDAGVIGSTVRMGLARYERLVREFRPDVVVAAFGAVNEHVASIGDPDDTLIRELAFGRGAFGRFTQRLRDDSAFVQLVAWWLDEARGGRAHLEQERREQRAWIGRNLGEISRPDWKGERRVSVPEFARDLRQLDQDVRRDGGHLVLLAPGRQSSVYTEEPVVQSYTDATFEAGRALGVPVVDGRAAMHADGAEYDALYLDHFHPTPDGHRRLAAALADAIAAVAGPR